VIEISAQVFSVATQKARRPCTRVLSEIQPPKVARSGFRTMLNGKPQAAQQSKADEHGRQI
jgi:hypothetical protein